MNDSTRPTVGADIITLHRGHRIRGRVVMLDTDSNGRIRIRCQYMGMVADPVDMIRPVWLDYGNGVGIRDGDQFDTNMEAMASGSKAFTLR